MVTVKGSAKGFTLLELIIVIGIIAVLGTVSVLVLNPAELFKQARDTTRMSDLATVSNAINLYLSNAPTPVLTGDGIATCGTNWGSSIASATKHVAATDATPLNAGVFTTGGAGWVSVNLGSMTPGGSPLGTLPRDPSNTTTYNYQYSCGGTGNLFYELDANLESTKYTTGATDKVSTDGGNDATEFEVGTSLIL